MTTGIATYPPVVKITSGRQRSSENAACGTEAASRSGSRTVCIDMSTVRSERSQRLEYS
jgi:hypothetical protein